MQWLIITTDNLPEAYVMARYLMSRSQDIALLNFKGRTLAQSWSVLKRLAGRRGYIYLTDFLLGRKFKKYYLKPEIKVFPDITDEVIQEIKKNIRCYDSYDPHSEDTLCMVKQMSPDYILFLGAPVIKPLLFNLAKCGTINWHHGLSPLYRGSDCVLWAMAQNDFENIGFTIHYVAEKVDGGKIILQRKVKVKKSIEFSEAVADILRQGLGGFIDVVRDIIDGKAVDARDQESGGRHYPPAGLSTVRRACQNFIEYARR